MLSAAGGDAFTRGCFWGVQVGILLGLRWGCFQMEMFLGCFQVGMLLGCFEVRMLPGGDALGYLQAGMLLGFFGKLCGGYGLGML